jgi:hypothetical protein
MQRKISTTHFFRIQVVSFLAIFGLLVLLPNSLSAQQNRLLGAFPVKQCIKLFENKLSQTEKLSARVENDSNGCIIEKSVEFFNSTDCTGKRIEHKFTDPEKGFVYKSGTDGGCPEAVEARHGSPACIKLTLKSGRKTTVCFP